MRNVFIAVSAVLIAAACGSPAPEEPTEQVESTGAELAKGRPCKPTLKYVSRNPEQCLAILFLCEQGREQFFNETGCGCACQQTANACDDPSRQYVSKDPDQCAVIRFFCESGEGFSDECGCGCIN
jgi:hypothetical protein